MKTSICLVVFAALASAASAQISARAQLQGAAAGAEVPAPATPSAKPAAEPAARAGEKPFAVCEATMQGVPATLSLFTSRAALAFLHDPDPALALNHKAEILADDAARTRVRMYVYQSNDVVFAEFDVPKTPASKVEIYAKNMGANWGVFDCTRP